MNAKLEEEAKRYWAQPRNFSIDRASHTVTVPAILTGSKKTSAPPLIKALAFVARYRPAEAADLTKGTWKIRYFDYDWSPNDAR